ncbi:hypothetical protein FOL46_003048 [Perkinsus olseni]|uniref:Uncharacterized protein n=1 Tax=Perkinsus olseni TaxID=32597 RepID=A0A7J6M522_PEROL|nr:hypothetical protein FOL46_003048 [Perkinsus olseni]
MSLTTTTTTQENDKNDKNKTEDDVVTKSALACAATASTLDDCEDDDASDDAPTISPFIQVARPESVVTSPSSVTHRHHHHHGSPSDAAGTPTSPSTAEVVAACAAAAAEESPNGHKVCSKDVLAYFRRFDLENFLTTGTTTQPMIAMRMTTMPTSTFLSSSVGRRGVGLVGVVHRADEEEECDSVPPPPQLTVARHVSHRWSHDLTSTAIRSIILRRVSRQLQNENPSVYAFVQQWMRDGMGGARDSTSTGRGSVSDTSRRASDSVAYDEAKFTAKILELPVMESLQLPDLLSWDVKLFNIDHSEMVRRAYSVFDRWGFVGEGKLVEASKLWGFINLIATDYHADNPYHNFYHAYQRMKEVEDREQRQRTSSVSVAELAVTPRGPRSDRDEEEEKHAAPAQWEY